MARAASPADGRWPPRPTGAMLYVAAGRSGAGPGMVTTAPGTVATYARDPGGALPYRSTIVGARPGGRGAGQRRRVLHQAPRGVRVTIRSPSTIRRDLARQAVAARTAGLAGGQGVPLARGVGPLRWRITRLGRSTTSSSAPAAAQASATIRLDSARPAVTRVKRRTRGGARSALRLRVRDRRSGVRSRPGHAQTLQARPLARLQGALAATASPRGASACASSTRPGNVSRWKAVAPLSR